MGPPSTLSSACLPCVNGQHLENCGGADTIAVGFGGVQVAPLCLVVHVEMQT